MIQLNPPEYPGVLPLVRSRRELSVCAVLSGLMPGTVYADRADAPSAALIRTSECNLLAGSPGNARLNAELLSALDFWDPVTPDTDDWQAVIPAAHPNRHIRPYRRCRYLLTDERRRHPPVTLEAGMTVEPVDPAVLRADMPRNAGRVLSWVGGWGPDERFLRHGVGFMVRSADALLGWSVADCRAGDRIAIGIYVDESVRRRGVGLAAASACADACFAKGYREIDWLCVRQNRGSRAIAEKLGFALQGEYTAFSSYPPIENVADLTEAEWAEWAVYLESALKSEPRLLLECLHTCIKANLPDKTITLMENAREHGVPLDYSRFGHFVSYLQTRGLCSRFGPVWQDYMNGKLR